MFTEVWLNKNSEVHDKSYYFFFRSSLVPETFNAHYLSFFFLVWFHESPVYVCNARGVESWYKIDIDLVSFYVITDFKNDGFLKTDYLLT